MLLDDGAAGLGVAAHAHITATDARDGVDGAALVRDAGAAPLVLPRAEADHRVHARPGSGLGSLVVLPFAGGGALRGALVAARRTPDAFEADDVAALDAFAAQAALALSHADLVAGAIERDRMARELTLAREVQRRLFPQALPAVAGLQIAAAERPALEVGGDYYDAVALGETCAGVVVADVSGKGTAAAFHMAEMKGVFQAGARLTRAPAEWLARASEALAPSLGAGTFVSAAYAVVDAEAGTLALARAGHCPPVLARDPALPAAGRASCAAAASRSGWARPSCSRARSAKSASTSRPATRSCSTPTASSRRATRPGRSGATSASSRRSPRTGRSPRRRSSAPSSPRSARGPPRPTRPPTTSRSS